MNIDLNTLFTIIFMEIDYSKQLKPCQIGENISFVLFNQLLNYFNYIIKHVIGCLFNTKHFVYKKIK